MTEADNTNAKIDNLLGVFEEAIQDIPVLALGEHQNLVAFAEDLLRQRNFAEKRLDLGLPSWNERSEV